MFSVPNNLLAALLALLGAEQPRTQAERKVAREPVMVRVPVVRPRALRPVPWAEKKGPNCLRSGDVIAASLAENRAIDFWMRDRRRIRAKMDSDCPTLDFYGDFYLQPEAGRICAGRDEIRPRIGGTCRIERFRLMVPRPAR